MRTLLICISALFTLSFAQSVTFADDFSSYQGQEVKIRGFLYEKPDKTLILAPQPNLKSCCLGRKEQIVVEGSALPSLFAQTISGIIEMSDDEIRLKQAQNI